MAWEQKEPRGQWTRHQDNKRIRYLAGNVFDAGKTRIFSEVKESSCWRTQEITDPFWSPGFPLEECISFGFKEFEWKKQVGWKQCSWQPGWPNIHPSIHIIQLYTYHIIQLYLIHIYINSFMTNVHPPVEDPRWTSVAPWCASLRSSTAGDLLNRWVFTGGW